MWWIIPIAAVWLCLLVYVGHRIRRWRIRRKWYRYLMKSMSLIELSNRNRTDPMYVEMHNGSTLTIGLPGMGPHRCIGLPYIHPQTLDHDELIKLYPGDTE